MNRSLAFLHAASAVVLGTVWFTVLVTLWATGVGLAITLLGLPVIWLTLVASDWMAKLEAELSNRMLGTAIVWPAPAPGWRLMERLRSRPIWHAQLYLLARFIPGLIFGSVLLGLVVQGAGMLVAPAWYWAPKDGIDLGIVQLDTLPEALAAIPLGAAMIALGWWLAGPYAKFWGPLATRLLTGQREAVGSIRVPLAGSLAVAVVIEAICLIVWAATGTPGDWPVWPAFGLATWVAFHAGKGPWQTGAVVVVMNVALWALIGGGYFWPVWVALGVGVLLGLFTLAERTETATRLREVTRTRAQVVDAQEDELRRIERDLHDGAQARLVSLAMSLGLAESRLDEDPERARELMAEAQDQARVALRELRDLARGIAPPVLQDRGLTAAIEALAATAPLSVDVRGDGGRAPAAIERAGYFVAAEALANAAKHAQAQHVRITVTRFDNRLEVDVSDDGRGGANPDGGGLAGLRKRVEAVDGTLEIRSPAGEGTIIRASLPCG